jgi:hypothetical protein
VFDTITAVTLVPDPMPAHFYSLQIADVNGTLRCSMRYGLPLNKLGAIHFRCKEGAIFLPRGRYVLWWSSNVTWGTKGRSSTGIPGTPFVWGPTARLLGSGTSAGQYLTSYYSALQETAVAHGALVSAVPVAPRYGTLGDIPLFQLHDSSED